MQNTEAPHPEEHRGDFCLKPEEIPDGAWQPSLHNRSKHSMGALDRKTAEESRRANLESFTSTQE